MFLSWLFRSTGKQQRLFGNEDLATTPQAKGTTFPFGNPHATQHPGVINPQIQSFNQQPILGQPGVAQPNVAQPMYQYQQPTVSQQPNNPPPPFQPNQPQQPNQFNGNPQQPNQKPFNPKIQTSEVVGSSVSGIHQRRKQYDNAGITVNRKIKSSGNAWTAEHAHQTGNLCFKVNGSTNLPFAGLITAFGGQASESAPPNHSHYIVFNNQLQRLEKRAYPNNCPPSSPHGKYMLVERCVVPYDSIASFEVECSESHINNQFMSHVICVTDGGVKIALNKEEVETVEVSTEKAEVLYQALDYALEALEKSQQIPTQSTESDPGINPNENPNI